jgi:hypothetical protein
MEQMKKMNAEHPLKKNMPLASASLFFFFLSIHIHIYTKQTNYAEQKIDGLWKFSREHKRRYTATRLKTEIFLLLS